MYGQIILHLQVFGVEESQLQRFSFDLFQWADATIWSRIMYVPPKKERLQMLQMLQHKIDLR